jgi:hypothetical protein
MPVGVDQHVVKLDITVGRACIVYVGQRFQQLDQPLHLLGHRWGLAIDMESLGQGDRRTTLINGKWPLIMNPHVQDLAEPGVSQPRGQRDILIPVLQRLSIGRLDTRHAQQHLGADGRIKGQPAVGGQTLAQQLAQLEARKASSGVGASGGGISGVHGLVNLSSVSWQGMGGPVWATLSCH